MADVATWHSDVIYLLDYKTSDNPTDWAGTFEAATTAANTAGKELIVPAGTYDFTTETIEAGGKGPSIAVDSNNKVHIAHAQGQPIIEKIRYVTNVSGDWNGQTVMHTGNYSDSAVPRTLAVDANDKIHIVRFALEPLLLEYATDESGAWTEEILFQNTALNRPSIVIGNDNIVSIVYQLRNGEVELIRFFDEERTTENITQGYALASTAVDAQGFIHVVFYEGHAKDLKYATNYSGTWKTMTLDSTGDVGDFCDIAIDSQDRLHISYYDRTNTDLKYATTSDDP